MKKIFIIALVLAINATSQLMPYPVIYNLYGGMSKMLEEKNDDLNLGFNAGVSVLGVLNPNLSMGLNATYNRWMFDVSSVDASLNFTEFSGIVRASTIENNDFSVFGQVGVGYFLGMASHAAYGFAGNEKTEHDFGISLGGGINLKMFFILPNYKVILVDSDHTTTWFALSAGISL